MFSRLLVHFASRHGWRSAATAFGLGALSAAALPPVFAVPVLWLTIPGLLAMLGAAGGWRGALLRGWCFGWGFFVAGLYWITYALLTDVATWWWLVPIAVPALALPLGLFVALPGLVAWAARPGWARVLGLACAWTLAEMLRGVVFTGFPWNLLGTVWAFDAVPLQGAALLGVHGLTLLTVILASLPILGPRPLLAGAMLTLLALAGGAARLWQAEPPPLPVSLVIVQANIPQEAKWRDDSRLPNFTRHVTMSRDGLAAAAAQSPPGTRLVAIWPETASPFLLTLDAEARRQAVADLPPDGLLLAGSVRAEFGPDRRLSALFNSLVALDPAAEVRGVYDKAHLVPFGEYTPFRGLLPIRLAHGAVDFSAGPGQEALDLPGLPPVGVLVCYEVIFPAEVVGATRPGWLLNVTNDGWFGVSAGPHQHLAAARLRAVEEGLPLVRAAQTGISAVFDARGRTVGRLALGAPGILITPLPQALPPPPFARFGLLAPGLAILLCAALGLWCHQRAPSPENVKI